ncbi:uncharacterized protein LOC119689307 isoform X2 [Teleopsis dalmanni]|uniref:uncharacterized protein LOC119689307 isoform X2 n=1 Tax=Teleopsis dalmanni TaxID=139649 RepID=UPI0018CF2F87|nr:uncharacterized protein LOC119689307 isoform X2 [Teleopsis dalmanni]
MRYKKIIYGECRKCQKHMILYSSSTCHSCHKKELQSLKRQVTVHCNCEQKRRFTKPTSDVQVGNKNSEENIYVNHFVKPFSLFSSSDNNKDVFETKESLFEYRKPMNLFENASRLSANIQKKPFDPVLALVIVQKADQMFSNIKVKIGKLQPSLKVYDAANNDKLQQLLMITFLVQKILDDLLNSALNDSTLTNTRNDTQATEVIFQLSRLVATSTEVINSFGTVVISQVNSFQIANNNECDTLFNDVCNILSTEQALFDFGDLLTDILTNGAESQDLLTTEISSTPSATLLYKNLVGDTGYQNESPFAFKQTTKPVNISSFVNENEMFVFSEKTTSDDDFDKKIDGNEVKIWEADEKTSVTEMIVGPIVLQLVNSACLE